MRTRDEVSEEKLRGGFYSPDILVNLCIERASALLGDRTNLRVLEPSAGDGAFIRGLDRSSLRNRIDHIEAVELLESEATKCDSTLESTGIPGQVVHESILHWNQRSNSEFDLILANPPYVRFQFISDADKQLARGVSARVGAAGSSVSNLWIPVFLLALSKLRDGGVFSVILPTEFLTGVSASAVRDWLLDNTSEVQIDLFKPGSFPSVLQEVLILTGRLSKQEKETTRTVRFQDHNGGTRTWSHVISPRSRTWTSYLLTPLQRSVLEDVTSLTAVSSLGTIARFSVSTVTGANAYFCLNSSEIEEFGLSEWAIPLLPRTRYSKGILFDEEDAKQLDELGHDSWMLSFSADKSSPTEHDEARQYLERGVAEGIDARYKCRVRTPWYRVPVVPAGDLLLSKRSNRFPRVISNHAGVVTTDTIYRGQILPGSTINADDFTASFHNTLTMLSAEIEGRSFGGGVLELVPSEVNSLQIPVLPGVGRELTKLDHKARTSKDAEELISETDRVVMRHMPELTEEMLAALSEARHVLMDRRLQRTHSNFYAE